MVVRHQVAAPRGHLFLARHDGHRLELACAVAVTAYDRVRGRGASVVPVVPQEVG